MRAALVGTLRNAKAPSVVAVVVAQAAATSLTFTQPATVRPGDVGVLMYRNTYASTPPGGWTAYGSLYVRNYDGTEGPTVTITQTALGNIAGVLVVVRSLHPTSAYATHAKGSDTYSGTAVVAASATPTSDSLALAFLTTQSPNSTVTMNQGFKLAQAVSGDRMVVAGIVKRLRSGQASGTTTFTIPTGTAAATGFTLCLKVA